MIVMISIYVLGVLGFFIHLFFLKKEERTQGKIIELLLLYQIVFSLGLTSLLAFAGLSIMPDYIATYTGWPSCPFEQQLANVNLAFGVLGILCIWFRDGFWSATILGFSIWILSDGIHHALDSYINGNYEPGNIGVPLITDFAIPIILLILLVMYRNNVTEN